MGKGNRVKSNGKEKFEQVQNTYVPPGYIQVHNGYNVKNIITQEFQYIKKDS